MLVVILTGDARTALQLAEECLKDCLKKCLQDQLLNTNDWSGAVRNIVDVKVATVTCHRLGFDAGNEESVLKSLTPLGLFFLVSLIVSDCGNVNPATVHDMYTAYNSYRATKHLDSIGHSELLLLIQELETKKLLQGGQDGFGKRFRRDPLEAVYKLKISPANVLVCANLLEMCKPDLRCYIATKKTK